MPSMIGGFFVKESTFKFTCQAHRRKTKPACLRREPLDRHVILGQITNRSFCLGFRFCPARSAGYVMWRLFPVPTYLLTK